QAVVVLLEQRIPFRAPEHLDNVPSGSAERCLELLDDVSVATDRTIEALQIAVDDEDQVVEFFTRWKRNGTESLRLVGLTISDEGPDLRIGAFLQAAIFQIAHETRLIDRHDRTKAHRNGWKLPE